jgi:hypothetical protein
LAGAAIHVDPKSRHTIQQPLSVCRTCLFPQKEIVHLNIFDVILGGSLVVSGVYLLKRCRREPDSALMRKLRVLSILLMIIGWMLVVWDPVVALTIRR